MEKCSKRADWPSPCRLEPLMRLGRCAFNTSPRTAPKGSWPAQKAKAMSLDVPVKSGWAVPIANTSSASVTIRKARVCCGRLATARRPRATSRGTRSQKTACTRPVLPMSAPVARTARCCAPPWKWKAVALASWTSSSWRKTQRTERGPWPPKGRLNGPPSSGSMQKAPFSFKVNGWK